MMSLENLIHYQLSEGLTEHELAKDIGVPKITIHGILKGRVPKNPDIWKKLARYFHMDVDLLRFGKFGLENIQGKNENPVGRYKPYRKVPILSWTQACHCVKHLDSLSFLSSPQGMVETELSGERVFALHVKDDSMEPLFHEGEIFFVNPELRPQAGHYVVVLDQMVETDPGCLRQLKKIRQQYVLHPLNRQYKDTHLTNHLKLIGRVVRLRMNL